MKPAAPVPYRHDTRERPPVPKQPVETREANSAPYPYLLTTMALFGAAFTSSEVVVGQMPHPVAGLLRFGGGAVILVVLLWLRPGSQPFTWREVRRAGAVGLIGVFAYNFLFFWGVSLAPAVDGSVIVPVLSPVITTFFLLASGRETASRARVAGLVLAVAGSVVFFVGRARLYDDKNQLARDLQQALLPRKLPALNGVRTAVRYLPVGRGLDVGGDFYDVIRSA